MEEIIATRLAELEKARENLVVEANQRIASLSGAIEELRKLVDPPPAPEQSEGK